MAVRNRGGSKLGRAGNPDHFAEYDSSVGVIFEWHGSLRRAFVAECPASVLESAAN